MSAHDSPKAVDGDSGAKAGEVGIAPGLAKVAGDRGRSGRAGLPSPRAGMDQRLLGGTGEQGVSALVGRGGYSLSTALLGSGEGGAPGAGRTSGVMLELEDGS